MKTIPIALALLVSGSIHAQAWRNCVPDSIGPGGCDSIGPGGGLSIGPGGGQSIGPGGGLSIGPGCGQSIGPGGGYLLAQAADLLLTETAHEVWTPGRCALSHLQNVGPVDEPIKDHDRKIQSAAATDSAITEENTFGA